MKRISLLFLVMLCTTLLFAQTRPTNKGKVSNALLSVSSPSAAPAVAGEDQPITDGSILTQTNGKYVVDILSKNVGALVAELNSKGITVLKQRGGKVVVSVSKDQIASLSTLQNATSARPVFKPQHNNSVISEGVTSMRSDIARSTFGLNGAGVKVGIMSDSYNNLGGAAAGVASGNLPGAGNPNGFTTPVQIISDLAGGGSDEGRAMAEIVHDVAPGSPLAFYTAFNSDLDFADGIIALKDAGCKVITDDVFYYAEPYFQDGPIAQAVNAVKAAGVSYFSSAGNNSNKSYERAYQPGYTQVPGFSFFGDAHNFGAPASPSSYLLPITLAPGTNIIIMQWDDDFVSVSGNAGAQTDLDLYFYNANGTYNSGIFSNDSNIGGDPIEGLQINSSGGTRYLYVEKWDGPDPGRLKIIIYHGNNSGFPNNTIEGVNASCNVGHSNTDGAIATGAVAWFNTPAYGLNPPVINGFSSRGGTPILLDVAGNRLANPIKYQKPEITAPDGGNNSFFGNDSGSDADALPNFFGTSAAAPHAAGVAALMLQGRNGSPFTPADMKTFMQNACIDMDDPDLAGFQTGFDYRTGYGLLQADRAVAASICNQTVAISNTGTYCIGLSVKMSGGANISDANWWGPGSFNSTSKSPLVQGIKDPGTYTYSATVTYGPSCTASVQKSIFITGMKASNNGPTCSGGTIKLDVSTSPAGAHDWAGPSNYKSNLAKPTINNATTAKAGVYTATVTYNNMVCTATTQVVVNAPANTPALSNSPVCVGGAIRLTASATGDYNWKGPKSFTSTLKTPVISNAATNRSGVYSLTVTGSSGCFSTGTVSVTVNNCSSTRLAAEDVSDGIILQVGPNPTQGVLQVNVELPTAGPLLLKMTDAMGRSTGEWLLPEETTTHSTELDITKQKAGVYFLQTESGGRRAVMKITKTNQ